MKRRIFIAINLPENIKKRLFGYRNKHEYLPVRWTKKNSLHLTLVFIGYVSDEEMLEICRATREVAARTEPFTINFKQIILGPPNKTPRLIWAEGEASKELSDLKNRLEQAFLGVDSGFGGRGSGLFNPHITLARIKMGQWQQAQISRADVEEKFDARVGVDAIDVMESDLKRDGAEYIILESCALGE